MYEQYYGLREKPFGLLPDPSFMFWSREHTMAYAMLEYGVLNHAGFTVITGGIGCGEKTIGSIGDEIGEIDHAFFESEPSGVQLGQIEKISHQPFETTSLRSNNRRRPLLIGCSAFTDGFGEPANRGKWCA